MVGWHGREWYLTKGQVPPSFVNRTVRMVGGESRKSRRSLAAADSKASVNPCGASPRKKSGAMTKNTSLKGLTSLIMRSVLKSGSSEGK